jgi:ketosteroid isomerase-like protein
MKSTKSVFGILWSLPLALAGCGGEPATEEAPAAEPMSQAGANAVRGAIVDAFLRKDAVTAAAFYADDAARYTSDGNVSTGKDAIQTSIASMHTAGFDSIGMVSQSFEASGDGATDRGTSVIRQLDPQTKEATRYNANYMWVFARQPDGTFKIATDSVWGMTEIR